MFLAFLLGVRHFVYLPWYSAPQSEDRSMRSTCRGWGCGSKQDPESADYLQKIFGHYKNGTLPDTLSAMLQDLTEKNYGHAQCARGLAHLFGFGDYEIDPVKSLQILEEGGDVWSCHEGIAFHPLATPEQRQEHLLKAAEKGSILAMQKVAFEETNVTKKLILYRHLLNAGVPNWYRKHKPGKQYANNVLDIYMSMGGQQNSGWENMINRTRIGHYPSSIWTVDGVITGRAKFDKEEAVSILTPIIVKNAPWRFNVHEVLKAQNDFNKTALMEYMIRAGDDLAKIYLSYPELANL